MVVDLCRGGRPPTKACLQAHSERSSGKSRHSSCGPGSSAPSSIPLEKVTIVTFSSGNMLAARRELGRNSPMRIDYELVLDFFMWGLETFSRRDCGLIL